MQLHTFYTILQIKPLQRLKDQQTQFKHLFLDCLLSCLLGLDINPPSHTTTDPATISTRVIGAIFSQIHV